MRKHRILGKALLLAVCLTLLPFSLLASVANAYGEADGKLIITHINVPNSYEGAGVIISGTTNQTVGAQGNYLWWKVLIFDWDPAQSCFTLKEKNLQADGNADKSNMQIPQNGFAYALCVGNDYSASGGVNYITQRMKDCYAYVDSIAVGEKAYLYGTSLADGKIQNNGKQWYAADFESSSYISIGQPVAGETAYDPTNAEVSTIQTVIKPNHVNDRHYEMQDCNLFTPAFGKYAQGNGDFAWWTCAVFSWDASQECYVCIATDANVGNGCAKSAPIPPNGFVLMDCASAYGTDIQSMKVGERAYLYQDGDAYEIAIKTPLKGKQQKTPENASAQLASPAVKGLNEQGKLYMKQGESIAWDAVDGATGYSVTILHSSPNPIGTLLTEPQTVTEPSLTVDASVLKGGSVCTLYVTAEADGKCPSTTVAVKLICLTEEAANSPYREKTVVAFGDSLTARAGWVSMLESRIGTEVINAGVGGDTSVNGKARFQKDVLDRKPDVVLICFGMNDQAAKTENGNAPNVSLDTYKENLTFFITELQKIGADVVLITPHDPYAGDGYYQPGGYGLNYAYGNMEQFCEAIRQLANDHGCGLIDVNKAAKQSDPKTILALGDGIHQSPEGHTFWAETVSAYLLSYTPSEPSEPSKPTEPTQSSAASEPVESASSRSEAPAESTGTSSETEQGGFPVGWIIAGIVLACLLVGVIILCVMKKRK